MRRGQVLPAGDEIPQLAFDAVPIQDGGIDIVLKQSALGIFGSFHIKSTKNIKCWTALSPILMKLSTLVHLYEKCINPKFFFDLTSRGLAMEVKSFGLEAKMLFFKCL